MDATPAAAVMGMKPTTAIPSAPQPTKIATPPLTGIGKSQFHHYHKPHNDPRQTMTYVMIMLFVV